MHLFIWKYVHIVVEEMQDRAQYESHGFSLKMHLCTYITIED